MALGAEAFHCTKSCQWVSHRNGMLTGAFGGLVFCQRSRLMPVARLKIMPNASMRACPHGTSVRLESMNLANPSLNVFSRV